MSKLPLSLLVACASALAAPSLTGATSFTPDDPLFAPSVGSWGQWHLANLADYSSYFPEDAASLPWLTHVQGNNVVGAWALGYTGTGVVIGIIDDGVEGGHPDLLANYRADLSKNFSQGDIANQPQRPYQTDDDHGTSVAGVAAAVGGNGIGVTGAAPHAQIAGLRISSGGTEDDPAYGTRDVINAFLWHSGVSESGNYTGEAVVSIKNNSWGENVPFLATDADAVKVIRNASRNNVIFVFAAGNERGTFSENANTYLLNVAEPVISVAAFGSDGKFSDYSNYGSSTFVTAASNSLTGFEIITTDRVGTPGYDTSDYAYDFGGTSSSAPLVSGILALGKEAAPALDVRWAKHTLANTSLLVDATDSSLSSGVVDWSAPSLTGRGWQTNGAGLHFNPNYGFGMVDAEAFVKRVVETAFVTERTTYTLSKYSIATKLAANSTATATTPALNRDYLYAFKLSGSQITQSLESVEVHVALRNGRAWKDLLIQLVSPDGTVSDLYTPLLNAPTTEEAASATLQGLNNGLDWTFSTNAFWGETGIGDWKLLISNYGTTAMDLDQFTLSFNQGDVALESDLTAPLDKNLSIHALAIDIATTNFVLPVGRTLTVADSTILTGGKIEVAGRIAETSYKGNQLIITGGEFSILETGRVDAKRGAILSGGTFNLSGQLNTPSGTTLQETTTTEDGGLQTKNTTYKHGLIITGGTFNAGAAAAVGLGILQTGGDVNIVTGKTLTTPTLDAQGTFSATGETLEKTAKITLSGVLAGNIVARDGAVVDASDNAKISGSLTLTGTSTVEASSARVTLAADSNIEIGGAVNVANGILTVNADSFRAKQINVTGTKDETGKDIGGQLLLAKAITLAAPLTQTGGNVYLQDNATFSGGIQLAGGTFTTSDDTTAAKRLATPQLTLQGTGRFDLGGATPVTLNLDGAFSMNGGNLAVNVIGAVHDQLNVSGAATFNKGNIELSIDVKPNIEDLGDITTPRKRINIVSSASTSGNVLTITGENAYTDRAIPSGGTYTVPVSYKFDTTTGDIVVGFDYASSKFLDTLNPTQRGIGLMLNRWELLTDIVAGAPDEPLLRALNNLQTFSALTKAYDQLLPVNTITLGRSTTKQANALTSSFDRRTRDLRRGALQAGSIWTNFLFAENYGFDFSTTPRLSSTPYANTISGYNEKSPLTLWMNGGVSTWRSDHRDAVAGTKTNQYNAMLGLDYRWETGYRLGKLTTYDLGLLVGYNNTSDKLDHSRSRNELDAVEIGAYFSTQYRGFYANALASYAVNSYQFKRDINIPGLARVTATTKPDGEQILAYISAGYEWEANNWAHGPTLALHYARTQVDGYREKGAGSLNLSVGDQNYDSVLASVGYRITRRVQTGWATLLPEVRAAWHHEFEDNARTIGVRTSNNLPFTVQSSGVGEDYATFGAGLTFLLTENASLSFDYDATVFQKHLQPQHTVNAMLRVAF